MVTRRLCDGYAMVTRRLHGASSCCCAQLDGFEGNKSTVLVAATNRPQDLDAALLSRFELSVRFPLPEPAARRGIFGALRHATHVTACNGGM